MHFPEELRVEKAENEVSANNSSYQLLNALPGYRALTDLIVIILTLPLGSTCDDAHFTNETRWLKEVNSPAQIHIGNKHRL